MQNEDHDYCYMAMRVGTSSQVPSRPPAVTTLVTAPPSPPATWQRTAVAVCHVDVTHTERPTRAEEEGSAGRKEAPPMVSVPPEQKGKGMEI